MPKEHCGICHTCVQARSTPQNLKTWSFHIRNGAQWLTQECIQFQITLWLFRRILQRFFIAGCVRWPLPSSYWVAHCGFRELPHWCFWFPRLAWLRWGTRKCGSPGPADGPAVGSRQYSFLWGKPQTGWLSSFIYLKKENTSAHFGKFALSDTGDYIWRERWCCFSWIPPLISWQPPHLYQGHFTKRSPQLTLGICHASRSTKASHNVGQICRL